MPKKEPQKPPGNTSELNSEHVKSQNFLGAWPQTPLAQSKLWAPLFVLALGPPNPLGDPLAMIVLSYNFWTKNTRFALAELAFSPAWLVVHSDLWTSR